MTCLNLLLQVHMAMASSGSPDDLLYAAMEAEDDARRLDRWGRSQPFLFHFAIVSLFFPPCVSVCLSLRLCVSTTTTTASSSTLVYY